MRKFIYVFLASAFFSTYANAEVFTCYAEPNGLGDVEIQWDTENGQAMKSNKFQGKSKGVSKSFKTVGLGKTHNISFKSNSKLIDEYIYIINDELVSYNNSASVVVLQKAKDTTNGNVFFEQYAMEYDLRCNKQ